MRDMAEKRYCVYIHKNKVNGKVYVGTTSQRPENRFRKNGMGYFRGYTNKTAFQEDIEKYGWSEFSHTIVATGLSEPEAKAMEQKLIRNLSANDNKHGYNLTLGGDGMLGYKCSDELRRAKSDRMKGIVFSEETRKKMSEAKRGYIPWNKGKHPGCSERQLRANKRRAQKVKTVDGVFESVTACAKHYGVERKTVQEWLSGKRKPSRRYAHICASYTD